MEKLASLHQSVECGLAVSCILWVIPIVYAIFFGLARVATSRGAVGRRASCYKCVWFGLRQSSTIGTSGETGCSEKGRRSVPRTGTRGFKKKEGAVKQKTS